MSNKYAWLGNDESNIMSPLSLMRRVTVCWFIVSGKKFLREMSESM